VEDLADQFEVWEQVEGGLNHARIFFWLEAAGAVEQSSARAKVLGGRDQKSGLESGEF
jgi:hypothetical protein